MSAPEEEEEDEPCGPEGEISKPMLFPWGNYERIFPPGTEFSEKPYAELYTSLQRENLSMLITVIVKDTVNCIGSLVLSTGALNLMWKYRLSYTRNILSQCIRLEKKRVIPIRIGQLIFSPRSVYPQLEGFRSEFPDAGKIEAMFIESHSNMLLVDTINKIAEHFEPNGVYEDDTEELDKTEFILDSIRDVLTDEYRFCHSYDLCPPYGPQSIARDARCYVWSMLYLHLRLKNPHMSGYQIVREMIRETKKGPPLTVDWLDVIENTLEELNYEDSIYPDKLKARIDRLRFTLDVPDLKQITEGLIQNDPPRDSERYEQEKEFLDRFRAGQTIVFGKRDFAYISPRQLPDTYRYEDNMWIVVKPLPKEFVVVP